MVWISVDKENRRYPVLERFLWEKQKGMLKLIVLGDPARREILLELGFGKQSPYASCHNFAPRLEKRLPVNYFPPPVVYDFLLLCIAELADRVFGAKRSARSYGNHKGATYKTWILDNEAVIEERRSRYKKNITVTIDAQDLVLINKLKEEEPHGKHWSQVRIPWFIRTCDKRIRIGHKRKKSYLALRTLLSQQENKDFLRSAILAEAFSRMKRKKVFMDFLESEYPHKLKELALVKERMSGRYLSFTFKDFRRKNGALVLRVFPFETDKTLPEWLENLLIRAEREGCENHG